MILGAKIKSLGKMLILITLLLIVFATVGCNNPLVQYYKYVQNYKYLPLLNPMEHAGPGSFVAGKPDNTLIMPPSDIQKPGTQNCFPPYEQALKDGLVNESGTALATIKNSFETSAYANFSLDLKTQGIDLDVSAGAEFHLVKSISMEVVNPVIVSFDFFALRGHSVNMPTWCQDELKSSQLIIQGLKAEKIIFEFKNAAGTSMGIKGDAFINNLIKINAGLGYKIAIENEVKLVFDKSLFIGMKLGKFDNNGRLKSVASTVNKNGWVFVPISKYVEDKSNYTYESKNAGSYIDNNILQLKKLLKNENEYGNEKGDENGDESERAGVTATADDKYENVMDRDTSIDNNANNVEEEIKYLPNEDKN